MSEVVTAVMNDERQAARTVFLTLQSFGEDGIAELTAQISAAMQDPKTTLAMAKVWYIGLLTSLLGSITTSPENQEESCADRYARIYLTVLNISVPRDKSPVEVLINLLQDAKT